MAQFLAWRVRPGSSSEESRTHDIAIDGASEAKEAGILDEWQTLGRCNCRGLGERPLDAAARGHAGRWNSHALIRRVTASLEIKFDASNPAC